MPLPLTGTRQDLYHAHLVYDLAQIDAPVSGVPPKELEAENISGHMSGYGPSSPWCAPVNGAWRQTFYSDITAIANPKYFTGVYEVDSHQNQDPDGL